MTTNPVGLASFSNLTPEESKENTPVLPHHLFEKALPPVTSAQPLAEVTQLMNVENNDPLLKVKRLFWSNGNRYEGETVFNDLPHGYGTLDYNTGIRYVGQFQEGKYHGQGTLTIPGEGIYEGEFKDGFFDGFGIFKYFNRDIFIGNYARGIRQGQGTLYYHDQGGSYTGGYQNGNRHGYGTLTSAAGDVYVGGFKDG